MHIHRTLLLVILVWLLPAGCRSYNDRVAGAVGAFARGDFGTAERAFSSVDSPFLRGVEAGMVAFTDGRFDAARAHLEAAEIASERIRDRALIGPDSLVDDVLSLAINESQSSYAGEGYERVMLHVLLALTYLAEGRPEDVLVEARRVDEILTGEEDLYDTDYGAGGIGHLLSAVAYELIGKPDGAYIDYRRMADKGLAPGLVGSALKRLARRLGRTDDLPLWEREYGESSTPLEGEVGSVVLIAGLGLGPAKREIRIDVPVKGGLFSWAVPTFGSGSGRSTSLALEFPESGARVETDVVENVALVAKENLDHRIGIVALRSAARGLFKRELADRLRDKENGEVFGLVADIFTFATERADLRAWRTLPREWVAARAFVPAGEPTEILLSEEGFGSERVALGTYTLNSGETMFVLARALDSGVVAHVVGGERSAPLDPEDADFPRTPLHSDEPTETLGSKTP